MYHPKDFIATAEGLVFAVVAAGTEDNKVRCFLRYKISASGWQKQDTEQANSLLAAQYPHYMYYSPQLDAQCHAVDIESIQQHFQPRQRLQALLQHVQQDQVLQDCRYLAQLLQQQGVELSHIGVTGSLLMGAQQASSDIDLVIYDAQVFQQTRQVIHELMTLDLLQDLALEDWIASYHRRAGDLTLDEYLWHEKRKHNKFMLNGRKVDISLLTIDEHNARQKFQKLGSYLTRCQVTHAGRAYHYPAEYIVDLVDIQKVVCFTATYIGQALAGEWIEVSGQLETDDQGILRIVVGSNREARGEYIKVIAHMPELLQFSAVIFDMDGLVLDTEVTYIAAWQQALEQMGYAFHPEFQRSFCGLAYPAIEQILLYTYGADFDLSQFALLSSENWRQIVTRQGIAVKTGVHNMLHWLTGQRIPYCLATNSPGNKALDCLALAGLPQAFPLVISREHVAQPKPQPDIFLKAAACLQVPIAECLVLEDSYTGVLAGSRAGACVVYIPSNSEAHASALAHREYPDLQQFLENLRLECP